MSIPISAMMGGNCAISGQKAKGRMDILRLTKYMGVQTVVDVNISPAACINTMQKRMRTGTKS